MATLPYRGVMLHEEFTAVTGIQMKKKLLAFINNYGQKCLDLLKCRRSAKESVRQLEAELQQLEENARKYRFAVGCVELLPLLVREQPKFLRGPDMHPALHFEGTNIYEATDVTVVFEAFNIQVIDIIAGMTAVMEHYWVLDVKYVDQNKNTIALLEHFCDLPSVSKAPLLLRAISAIKSGSNSVGQ
ncbi:uncharacterized protein LOC125943455 [Dermacentor silvarum]|uniref:uncharacterized protein LOC125943455 n=1 Tax=Dermacentor silvarum TaxID=543639 RepID=UPI0021013CC7|nr:uncharacterized protein LOC125943455 [Dermacentor silvarum]